MNTNDEIVDVYLENNIIPVLENAHFLTMEDSQLEFYIGFNTIFSDPWEFPHVEDPDWQNKTYKLVSIPEHGFLYQNEVKLDVGYLTNNQLVTYFPDPNYTGNDTFTYSVFDGLDTSNIASIIIEMKPVHDIPISTNQKVSLNEDEQIIIPINIEYIDDKQELAFLNIVDLPKHGNIYQYDPITETIGEKLKYFSSSQKIYQWAYTINNVSSEFAEEPNAPYSKEKMLGPPDTFPFYGYSPNGWTPLNRNNNEWIDVSFEFEVFPLTMEVYEVSRAGCINQIDMMINGTWSKIYYIVPNYINPPGKYEVIKIFNSWVCPINLKSDRYRIHFDGSCGQDAGEWNEVDAIQLGGNFRMDSISLENNILVYVPDEDYNGVDQFSFQINDCLYWNFYKNVNAPIYTIDLNITSVNDIPVSNISEYIVNIDDLDISYSIAIPASDVETNNLYISLNENPTSGTFYSDDIEITELPTLIPVISNITYNPPRTCTYSKSETVSTTINIFDGEDYSNNITLLFEFNCQDKYVKTTSGIFAAVSIISTLLLCLEIIAGIFIYINRKSRIIRLSSPIFLASILLGCIMISSTYLFWAGIPTRVTCSLRIIWISTGYVLSYISILQKNLRMALLFRISIDRKVKINNRTVSATILAVLGLTLSLSLFWVIKFPFSVKLVDGYYRCTSDNSGYLIVIFAILVGLSLLFGCYFSFLLRNVPGEYNEIKAVGFATYALFLQFSIMYPIYYILDRSVDAYGSFLLLSVSFVITSSSIMVLIFGLKVFLIATGETTEPEDTELSDKEYVDRIENILGKPDDTITDHTTTSSDTTPVETSSESYRSSNIFVSIEKNTETSIVS
eukprot:TRINITY_DN8945_c0_g1_i2.p1 TRINITY_DN8945_c0_g1~~TRINITY_DN8945_c0_g1_i2.p1  ORF type:complete len:846 (-),score=161.19 TRINITY_DN8945_c0_g1_i2:57-2594(-)